MNNSIQNVLVTGNLGYIGSILTPMLVNQGYNVTGYDTEFYGNECLFYSDSTLPIKQIKKDIRDVTAEDLEGIDTVIHLASLSNDPLGEFNPSITEEINFHASIRLAQCAKAVKVNRFLYASSQSMYGISDKTEELEEDNSLKNPLTSYAKTKWMAECELKSMGSDDFVVTCFRPSTVFGASPKLRCDIVFNSFVACAYTTNKIEIKSDGTPWRPVIHVIDVSNAFLIGLTAPRELIENESFNIGLADGNFSVRELAEAAQTVVPGSSLVFTGEEGLDSRTYRVSFNKIFSRFKHRYKPEWDLHLGGHQLVDLFKTADFNEHDFRGNRSNRLLHLKKLIESNHLSDDLRWR